MRAKVEDAFRIIKCQFGYRKTGYRDIHKNGAQLFSLHPTGKLYKVRRELLVT
ncbi:MAG: hypothetical protein DRQ61_07370 [Gammaproteobacteria bacterium]|nr:MAG: hypothetical protein DRQ56_07335 [Gammaproteobacteria bacterium]RLA22014.1 MAG: hypothetical protein DRQ61_07370 [Gammaproteobacteria bacterium]